MARRPSVRTLLAAAIAVVALLAPAATASADHGTTITSPTVARYLQIAERHWAVPAPTCTADDGSIIGVHAVLYDNPERGVVASAEQPGCRIWLDEDWWPAAPSERDCVTIVHEWGHLLGYGHSGNERSLMFSYPTGGAPECAFFARRATRARKAAPQAARKRCLRAQARREQALTSDAWSPEITSHARRHSDRRANAASNCG